MKAKTTISNFLLGLALFSCTTVFAQEQQTVNEPDLKTKVGIKGGLNLTNLYISNTTDEHIKAGFDAGVFVKVPVTRGFSIQPELLYTVKGAQDTYNNFAEGSGEYKFNLGYMEMPLLAVLNVAPNFNIHVGGYAAYLVNANVENVNNNGSIQGATSLNTGDFNRWDYGLIAGFGFDIQNVTLGARYNYGLRNIGKGGNLSGDITQNSKNAGFSIYAGIGF